MRRINLLQLLKDNADRPRCWRVNQEAGKAATVYVYDVIGGIWGGVQAEEFVQELQAIDAEQIDLRINSPGGDVFDARAIATALREHPANVTAYVDGLAASAATTIAMAADRVEIAQGGFFMIHNAWAFMYGNKNEMRDMADLLEKVDGAIAADYATKTGNTADQIAEWMNEESWFTADEAVENGFADAVMGSKGDAANWNLAAYRNAPEIPKDEENAGERIKADLERRLRLIESCSA